METKKKGKKAILFSILLILVFAVLLIGGVVAYFYFSNGEESHCRNGMKDQDETDIDCGGPTCNPCETGKSCVVNRDCSSNQCVAELCKTPDEPTCNNGMKDQDETDIDCGGLICNPCTGEKSCILNRDCYSNYCKDAICGTLYTDSCDDGEKNQDETDVDCGGIICNPCANGESCLINSDCSSNLCNGGICVSNQDVKFRTSDLTYGGESSIAYRGEANFC